MWSVPFLHYKIIGAPKKIKNWPRPLFRPWTDHSCHQKPKPCLETVLLSWYGIFFSHCICKRMGLNFNILLLQLPPRLPTTATTTTPMWAVPPNSRRLTPPRHNSTTSSSSNSSIYRFTNSLFLPVLRIHDILVWIRIRGSMPLTNGSGSCYFCQWPSKMPIKNLYTNPDPDPYLWLMDPDSDPGGPKTCGSSGSGSAILVSTHACIAYDVLKAVET